MGDGDAMLTKCSKNITDTEIAIALFLHIATALRIVALLTPSRTPGFNCRR